MRQGVRQVVTEPEFSSNDESLVGSDFPDSSESDVPSVEIERLGNSEWCQCDCCSVLPSVCESICCAEMPSLRALLTENNIECITEHPTFGILCLHTDVLKTAIVARADITRRDVTGKDFPTE